MIEINLVPDVKQELIRAQRVRSAVISGAISIGITSVAVIALLVLYVFAVQAVRHTIADNAIKEGAAQLSSVEDLSKVLTIQNQLTKISSQHDDKTITSRIFYLLQRTIPPAPNTVQISTLTFDVASQTITLEGQATNNYAAVEIFKKSIEGAQLSYKDRDGVEYTAPLAASVSTSDTSYGEDSSGARVLRFTLSFEYSSELFDSTLSDIEIKAAVSGNVTDSHLGLPGSIFTDRAADLTEGNE